MTLAAGSGLLFGPSSAEADLEGPAADALAHLLHRVYDPEIGLIRYIAEVPLQPNEPSIFLAIAESQNPFLVPPLSNHVESGSIPDTTTMGTGAALDRISALWATVGEALERYALHIYDEDDIVWGSANALTQPCVQPSAMILFDDSQYAEPDFRFVRFDPAAPIGWTMGIDLCDGSDVLLPASLTYLGYRARDRAECLDAGYSTGGAAGPTLEAAYVSGLLEVIERDGFACHWYLQHTPPEIAIETHAEALDPALLDLVANCPVRLRFLDLTTDLGIPTVLALGLPDGGGVVIGASARLNYADAITKAAIEACHTFNWILDLRRNRVTIDSLNEIRAYRDHVVYHLASERTGSVDFFLNGERPTPFPSVRFDAGGPPERLAQLVTELATKGYRAFGIDLTPGELLDQPIKVARAFVPGLHPLGCGTGNEHLDRRRLTRFAEAAGAAMPTVLTLDPHPFP